MPTIKLPKTRRQPTINKATYQGVYNTPRWKKLRAAKIKANPVCERCAERGVTRVADEVHHIVPFDVDMELAYDYDNLVSLCIDCHKEAHAKLKNFHYSRRVEYR